MFCLRHGHFCKKYTMLFFVGKCVKFFVKERAEMEHIPHPSRCLFVLDDGTSKSSLWKKQCCPTDGRGKGWEVDFISRGISYFIAMAILIGYSCVDSFADRVYRTKGNLVTQTIILAIAIPIFVFCVQEDNIIVGAAFIFVAFCSVRRMVKIVKNRKR